MRKLLIIIPILALSGCNVTKTLEDSYQKNAAADSQRVLRISTIVCADGNQVRMAVYALGGNSAAFTGWTILAEDGKPKRCVRREKSTAPQYEEVPQ